MVTRQKVINKKGESLLSIFNKSLSEIKDEKIVTKNQQIEVEYYCGIKTLSHIKILIRRI